MPKAKRQAIQTSLECREVSLRQITVTRMKAATHVLSSSLSPSVEQRNCVP